MKSKILKAVIVTVTFIGCVAKAQDKKHHFSRFDIEVAASLITNRQEAGFTFASPHIEGRIHYNVNRYLGLGLFAGYQTREYPQSGRIRTFTGFDEFTESAYGWSRQYYPVGISGRISLSGLFADRLGALGNTQKWNLYVTAFGGVVKSKVAFDNAYYGARDRATHGYAIYGGPRDMDYLPFGGALLGLKYYPVKSIGLFVEGGYGTVGNVMAGLNFRMPY